ncbi:microsomal glutathione s-transferase 1 [Plakobranchus ocellatus]|uniref:Microsomal glutathione S-transferase 1 n=1 Tax=Plakobranchus ocellatus TaxID=259542 RepID=A0AAV4BEY8_9GAST|nr:microsomal glutathione s-transferase 1 [Plakobranchus ocellatus]
MDPVFSLSNETFKYFLGHTAVVIAKTISVAIVTGFNRVSNTAYMNEEDAKAIVIGAADGKPKTTPTIDRLKRMHMNDLENVIPFVLIGLLYTATRPDPASALLHFRVFTTSRVLHSFVYYFAVPQPARALCFSTGMLSLVSMIYTVFSHGAL